MVREVQVLNSQLQRLLNPQARSVEQPRKQVVDILQVPQDRGHFVSRQHHGQPSLRDRAPNLIHPRQVLPNHLAVEEQQCRQGLPMARYRQSTRRRQVREKGLDLGAAHFPEMPQSVESHERSTPVHVGFFGPKAVVQAAHAC